MEQIIALAGPVLEELLSLAGSATTGQIQNIINIVERFIALAVDALPSIIPSLQNIINELSGNTAVTAAQLQTLSVQSAALDAALDAAAKDDGLTGVPGATGVTGP